MNLNQSLSLTDSGLGTNRSRSESLAIEVKNQNRRRILNSSSVKLNLELERMHTIELIELEEKLHKKTKKKVGILKDRSFDETNSNIKPVTKILNEEIKQSTTMPQIKPKAIKIIEDNTLKERLSSTTDQRFQSLIYSMTDLYRPATAKPNEKPDEIIFKLYRSNTAFLRNTDMITLSEQEKPMNRLSYDENYRRFEKAISML